jgi:hypothetical protein
MLKSAVLRLPVEEGIKGGQLLAGRSVAGAAIRTLQLDGVVYRYAVNTQSHLIVSPLMENEEVTARFISEHHLHGHEKGRDSVRSSLEIEFGGAMESAGDEFRSDRLIEARKDLMVAAATSEPKLEILQIGRILPILMGASSEVISTAPVSREARRCRIEEGVGVSEIDQLIRVAAGLVPPPAGASRGDAAKVIASCLDQMTASLPGNWSMHFQFLRQQA